MTNFFDHLSDDLDAFPPYRPLRDAPTDEWVLLATTGGWVGQAIFNEDGNETWRWIECDKPIPSALTPLGWMPMPPAITEPVP